MGAASAPTALPALILIKHAVVVNCARSIALTESALQSGRFVAPPGRLT